MERSYRFLIFKVSMQLPLRGELSAAGKRFAIVASQFNSFIVEQLVAGAIETIRAQGGSDENILIVHVPGALEIPIACQKLAEQKKFDALITVGAIVRGGTSHYDIVCNQSAEGVMRVSLDYGLPVTFGIITAENVEQALERAGGKVGNKGSEAAMAAIEMVNLLPQISKELR